jgi:gas vesicle protein
MKHKRSDKSGGKIAISAVVGGLAGYLTGVLTAPKSGKQTRNEIANKAEAAKEGAEYKLQEATDELNDTINRTKSKTIALSAKAREEYDESVIKAKDVLNKTGQVLKAVKAGQANDPDLNKAVKQAKLATKNLARYLRS